MRVLPGREGRRGRFHGIPNFAVYELMFERFNYAVTGKKIFGTDGVRGVANVEPVTAETALKLGRAAAYVFTQLNPRKTPGGARPKIVLGKDTRLSGYMSAAANFARQRNRSAGRSIVCIAGDQVPERGGDSTKTGSVFQ